MKAGARWGIAAAALTIAGTASPASILATPGNATPGTGELIAVLVHADDFPATAGATLGLTWNTGTVALIGITPVPGSPITEIVVSANSPPFSVLTPLSGPFASGTFDTFVMHFQAFAPGDADIHLVDDQVELCWADAVTFGCVTPIDYVELPASVAGSAVDITPDAFTFIDQTGVPLSTVVVSNPVTISGISAPAAVAVSGTPAAAGEYSINGGPFMREIGFVTNGDTIRLRHTSDSLDTGTSDTTLTVGGQRDTFTTVSFTNPPDTTPDPFAFVDQANADLSTVVTSAPVRILGLTGSTHVSISGAAGSQYSIDGDVFRSGPGTLGNGNTVRVRHTSSASTGTAVNSVLNVGGVTDTFTSTTILVVDTTPDPFTLVDQSSVAQSSAITSASVPITGINSVTPISVSGAASSQYSINGGPFVSTAGTIVPGSAVRVRHTSAASSLTAVDTTLHIGAVTDTFTSTTNDTTPEAFSFANQAIVSLATTITSNPVTISGINAAAPISVSGAASSMYSINGNPFTSAAGTIQNGGSVRVRHTSSSLELTGTDTVLTVGGVSATFTSMTQGPANDLDGDGILNTGDNCTLVANSNQLDADGDGYGNICDADLNNSGTITATDFGLLRSVLGQPAGASPLAAAADMNGSGTVTSTDFNLLRSRLNTTPGPSGLH